MKLVNIYENSVTDINTETLDFNDLISDIKTKNPEIILTKGANEATVSYLIKNYYNDSLLKKLKTVHFLEDNEAEISYPLPSNSRINSKTFCGNIKNNIFYPSESALIYSDRVIVKNRRNICYGDPMFTHYLYQFSFKIYEIPAFDTENSILLCKRLFRFQQS